MAREYEIKIKSPNAGQNSALIADGTIDLIEDFGHDFTTQFTDVPLEDGASIVDHAIDSPFRIRVNIVVTNLHTQSPEMKEARRREIEDRLFADELTNEQIASADFLSEDSKAYLRSKNIDVESYDDVQEGRPTASLEDLLKLKSERQLLTVTSLLFTYEDMVIEKISAQENAGNGTALIARIDMRQIVFAKSITTTPRTIPLDMDKMTPDEVRENVIAGNKELSDANKAKIAKRAEAKKAKADAVLAEKSVKKAKINKFLGKVLDAMLKNVRGE